MVRHDARLSRCGRYRYTLSRMWDRRRARVVFVGLNPSTADAWCDDATVRRCLGFARAWGFGALDLVNLFAFRSTDPTRLLSVEDPIGPENDEWIRWVTADVPVVVAIWGSQGGLRERDRKVLRTLTNVFCLGRTKEGKPRHVLYMPRSAQLSPFP